MGKRIFWVAILLAAVLCGYFYYRHHQEELRMANGDVTCIGCMSPEERTKFQQESTASGDSSNDARRKTPSAENTNGSTAGGEATMVAGASSTEAGAPLAAASATPAASSTTMSPTTAAPLPGMPLPAGDTIAANPPNGMVFSGKGTYQWYRQGNLTWRVDTTSGRSCIIYATMSEWRKEIVYRNGCGHSA